MAFWTTLKEQILALWNRWTIPQRAGFSAAALACVAAVVGTMIWAAQPDYKMIASQLTPQRSAEIVGVLETENIDYQLNYSGSAVSVASRDVAAARLALKNIISPDDTRDDAEEPNPLLPGSPRSEADRRRRAQEKQVGKQIEQLQGIKRATVTISQPDPTPFAVDQSPVTAAVVLEAQPGTIISSQVAQTALFLVARGVPGLTNENITLTDSRGHQFSSHEGIESELTWQLDFRQRLETNLALRAESLLQSAQGVSAKVIVTADIDYSEQTRTSNTFDPDAKAKRSESLVISKQDGNPAPPEGVPGTTSNIAADANIRNASSGKYSNEQIDTEYDNSFKSEEVRERPGKIVRLTVAAIVDIQPTSSGTPADPAGTPTAPAGPATMSLDQTQIENIVKGAVGFDASRNDEIQVVLAPLESEPLDAPVPVGFIWEQWQPLLQSVSLGLAASLAFLIGMLLMRRMKPIVIRETVGPGIPLADARRLATISEQARAHPDVVASILSAWLNEHETEAVPGSAAQTGDSPSVSAPRPTSASVPRSASTATGTPSEGRKAA